MATPFYEQNLLSEDSDEAARQILFAIREFSVEEQDLANEKLARAVVAARHGDTAPFMTFVDALWVSVQLRRNAYFRKALDAVDDGDFDSPGIDAGDLLGRLSQPA